MNQQFSLFESEGDKESASLIDPISDTESASLMNPISDAQTQALQRLREKWKDPIVCVNTYSPGRRKSEYYRLSYFQDGKTKHLHIPGGNTRAKLAQYRAGKLQELIESGAQLEEIIAAVETYRGG